jgi:hypothetical protein
VFVVVPLQIRLGMLMLVRFPGMLGRLMAMIVTAILVMSVRMTVLMQMLVRMGMGMRMGVGHVPV